MTTRIPYNLAKGGRVAAGMTLVELLLCVGVMTLVLMALVATANAVRTTHADQQTRQTLRMLHLSLNRYHADTGHWPQGNTDTALLDLLNAPDAARLLRHMAISTDGKQYARVLDGYGQTIRYQPAEDNNLGRPDFVSAGANGLFGDPASADAEHAAAASDNIHGSDTEGPRP